MDKLTHRMVTAQIAFTGMVLGAYDRIRRDDRGQGSVEYVGIILVVAALIVVLVAAATPIGAAIKDKIVTAVEGIG